MFFATATFCYAYEDQECCDEDSAFGMISVSELSEQIENEGLNIEDSNKYDISLIIKTDSSENTDFGVNISEISSNVDADAALRMHRDNIKNYYSSSNENIAESLGLQEYEYYVSFYSSHIEVIFDDLDEYICAENNLLSSLRSSDSVLSCYNSVVFQQGRETATVEYPEYSTNYPLSEAFDDIGVENSSYTGDGVKIGIIDIDVPNIDNLKPNKYYLEENAPQGQHSTIIASIIGGTSGIAEDVHFYCLTKTDSLIDKLNILVYTYDVNIINISLNLSDMMHYCKYDGLVDEFISNTGCTVVCASGNRGGESIPAIVVSPGKAMNTITVGSVNYNKELAYTSSYAVFDDYLYKPDVVAPGERLWDIPNVANDVNNGHCGTSFAAPMVVGTIALLMEEFPTLKVQPDLVKSIVHIGAESLPSQTACFDEHAGFGLINYTNMRNCMLNQNHIGFAIPGSSTAGSVVSQYPVTVPYLEHIKISVNTLVNNYYVYGEPTYPENAVYCNPLFTNYTIKLYDMSTNTYVATSTTDSSFDYLFFTNTNENNSAYRIDIVLEEDNQSNTTEIGEMAFRILPHTHSYTDHYFHHTDGLHKAYCECGEYQLKNHILAPGSLISPDGYGRCMLCRGRAFMGVVWGMPSRMPHTENGSYILPNGVIVLVDEDIESYFNGTLEFYSDEE